MWRWSDRGIQRNMQSWVDGQYTAVGGFGKPTVLGCSMGGANRRWQCDRALTEGKVPSSSYPLCSHAAYIFTLGYIPFPITVNAENLYKH